MKKQSSPIKIYVACLASYNNGILHGVWIEADREPEAIMEEIHQMLNTSPAQNAEEFAIHDYEGFEGVSIHEYQSIEIGSEIAGFIGEHGALGGQLIEYFGDLDEAKEAIEDQYAGVYRSVAEFAQEITEETTEIPDNLQYYIDYERMARDLEINDILTIETGFEEVHIFWRQ